MAGDVTRVGLPEVFRDADIVRLHAPATEQTRGLVEQRTLAAMCPGSYLITWTVAT